MDLGMWEMVTIALIAFVFLGPVEMIKLWKKLSTLMAKMRTEFNNFKVMAEEEILNKDEVLKAQSLIDEHIDDIKDHANKIVEADVKKDVLND